MGILPTNSILYWLHSCHLCQHANAFNHKTGQVDFCCVITGPNEKFCKKHMEAEVLRHPDKRRPGDVV